jgi:hypothetical protein
MCGKSLGKTLLSVGGPILGTLGGEALAPELGIDPSIAAGLGGLLGGGLGGFAAGDKPIGIAENAAFGGLGGFLAGEAGIDPFGGGAVATTPGVSGPSTAVSGAGAGGGAAGASAPGGNIISGGEGTDTLGGGASSSSGVMDFLKKNPQVALSLAGLAASGLAGGSTPGEKQLKSVAGEIGPVGNLSSTVLTGKLPPGAQSLVTNALNDTIAGIKAKYASLGIPGSTAEAQDIAAAQERASAQTFQIAQALTQEGLDAAGLTAQIYAQIAGIQLQQDQALSQALGGFAQAGGYGAGLKSAVG